MAKCYLCCFVAGFCAAALEMAALLTAELGFNAGQHKRNSAFFPTALKSLKQFTIVSSETKIKSI